MDTHGSITPLSRAPETFPPQREPHSAEKTIYLEAELTRLLYSQSQTTFLATLVNASILAVVLQAVLPATKLLAWFIMIIAITGARFALVRRHQCLAPTETQEGYWRTLYLLGTASNGVAWGSLCLFVFPSDLSHQVFIAFVFGGMGAGAATVLSSVPFAPLTFLVPTLAPLAIQFFLQGGSLGTEMGAMILIFFGSIVLIMRHIHTTVVETLELRFTQLGLLDRLATQTTDLEKTNARLQIEVTTRTQTEQALQESLARFDLAMQGTGEGIWEVRFAPDSKGRVLQEVYYSPLFLQLLGYQEHELPQTFGQDWLTWVHPEDLERVRTAMINHLVQHVPYAEALRMRGKDGNYRWFSARGQAQWDNEGRPIRMAGSLRDISRRKRLEDSLQTSEARYRELFENANDGIATFTRDGVLTSINRGLEHMLGRSREEMLGRHHGEFVTAASSALASERTRRAIVGDNLPSLFELELLHKQGIVVPVEARARLMRDQNGAVTGVQIVARDITDRKRAEAELRKAHEEL